MRARAVSISISDTVTLAAAEPTGVTEEAREITARRYICDADSCYHADRSCPQLAERSFSAVSRHEAVEMGREPCPVCQPDSPADALLFMRALGRSMLSELLPDYYYAFTRTNPYTGEYRWYFRSREDEDTYAVLAAFQTRPGGSDDEPMPDNFEEGGVRMKVWMNQEVDFVSMLKGDARMKVWMNQEEDFVSMLKGDAPEWTRDMVNEAEAALTHMPDMAFLDGRSPLNWDMRVYACFDAAREHMTSMDFFIDGPEEEVHFQWQRQEDGGYELTTLAVNGEGMS